MANVGLTEPRIKLILDGIMKLDVEALQAAKERFCEGPAALEMYYVLFPREEIDMLENSKWKWCDKQSYFYVAYKYKDDEGKDATHKILFHMGEGKEKPLPENCWYEWKAVELSPSVRDFLTPKRDAYLAAEATFKAKRARLRAQIANFPSLNALLKHWPSVIDYMDQPTKDLLNKEVKRGSRKDLQLDDEFAVAASTARLIK